MAPVTNGSAVFNKIPEGFPTLDTITYKAGSIDLDNVQLNGGILVKTLYLSIDPHLRRHMRAPEVESTTVPAYNLGETVWGFGLASVLRSEKDGVRQGDILHITDCPFQEYSVLPASLPVTVIKREPGIPLSAHLSVLGMPGKYHRQNPIIWEAKTGLDSGRTAYYGLELIADLKPGQIIYVSTGAGAVGSVVAQLAKANGLKVIASAGSDDKVHFMKKIGVDVAFNYKTEKVADVLAREGPIDIYWDNVGGATVEAVLETCNLYARIIVCGSISAFNDTEPYPVKNLSQILFKRIRMQGFMNWEAEAEVEGQTGNPVKFWNAVGPLVRSGKIKWAEQVFEGIDRAGEATVAVQSGASTAKALWTPHFRTIRKKEIRARLPDRPGVRSGTIH